MWLAEGFSFGITAAGGTGHYLAQMMVEGEAEIDMAALDPKRYGSANPREASSTSPEAMASGATINTRSPDTRAANARR